MESKSIDLSPVQIVMKYLVDIHAVTFLRQNVQTAEKCCFEQTRGHRGQEGI